MNLVSILHNGLVSNAWITKLKELVYDKSWKHETLANELQKPSTRKLIKRKIVLTSKFGDSTFEIANDQNLNST